MLEEVATDRMPMEQPEDPSDQDDNFRRMIYSHLTGTVHRYARAIRLAREARNVLSTQAESGFPLFSAACNNIEKEAPSILWEELRVAHELWQRVREADEKLRGLVWAYDAFRREHRDLGLPNTRQGEVAAVQQPDGSQSKLTESISPESVEIPW